MIVIYRISNNSNVRNRICSKEESLINFLSVFKCKVIVVADSCNKELIEFIKNFNITLIEINEKSNGKSFLYCLNLALNFNKDEFILFQEDDYLYCNDSYKIINEGLQISDYVTLYDHPDKYNECCNPFVKNNGEISKVLLTNSCHWKSTNSTTMTFACRVSTLIDDLDIIKNNIVEDQCLDFKMFTEIIQKGKLLISSIPAFCTHTETSVLSPFRNYDNNVYS